MSDFIRSFKFKVQVSSEREGQFLNFSTGSDTNLKFKFELIWISRAKLKVNQGQLNFWIEK